ncbi:hypothetical protein ABI59_06945 [Acidobacteria bacterium Mor1]|nr:hypothetical protein ABI59_06945 [Acidobacteria bacterium Mor1]
MSPTTGVWIAFISGLAWAGLDISRKSLTRDTSAFVIATALTLGASFLFAGWMLFEAPRIDLEAYLLPGLLSILFATATQVLIVESVRHTELSRAIPMLSLTPVATSVFGVLILGEHPELLEWVGIGLVFAGAFALGVTRDEGHRFKIDRGVALMLLAALSISAAAPFDKLAVQASNTSVHGMVQNAGGTLLLLGLLAWRRELPQLPGIFRRRPAMTLAVLLGFAAIALQFTAYQVTMVGHVETIKRVVGLVASLLAGATIFGERITLKKILTVAAMGAGVALLLA